MTIPEAIKWYDAKLEVNKRVGLLGPQNEAAKLALAALQEQEERKANPVLTLEELREMDGEPVWVCNWDGSGGTWALVDAEHEVCRRAKGDLAIFYAYNKTWLAYRRKPEEGTR